MARVRKGQKPPVPQAKRILIVTEDSEATPNYFTELVYNVGLSPRRVVIDGSSGSAPSSVVDRLIRTWEAQARGLRRGEIPFECAYAVVDRDDHDTFAAAKERVRQKNDALCQRLQEYADELEIEAITRTGIRQQKLKDERDRVLARFRKPLLVFSESYPCFEYWLLLHFRYTRAAIVARGNKSSGEVAESMVDDAFRQAGLGGYAKSNKNIWTLTRDRARNPATPNAERSREAARQTGRPNPSTSIDEIVSAVQMLKST